MAGEMQNRRSRHRCCKDVGMHCSLLHGKVHRLVTLRNFSDRGIYFESPGEFPPGSVIVLRTMAANEWMGADAGFDAPRYTIEENDPDACTAFRSHVVAMVKRCERLDATGSPPHYGVGAEIQRLTD